MIYAHPASQDDVKFIMRWFERTKAERVNWENTWQDGSDLLAMNQSFSSEHISGHNTMRRLHDSTAPKSAMRLVGAFHGMLTNPATRWHGLVHPDPEMNKWPPMREWMDNVLLHMFRFYESPRLAFNTQIQEIYLSLIGLGTGCAIFNEERGDAGGDRLRFAARPLGECYFSPDADGAVEAVFRPFKLTLRQCYEKFGEGIHEKLMKDVRKNKNMDERIEVLHAVYPRKARDPMGYSSRDKKIASCYIDVENSHKMHEGGFDLMPFLTPRFFKAPGEVYGYGPGTMMLADMGMINAVRRTQIMALELGIAPPLLVQSGSTEGPIRTSPLSITYVRAGSVDPIKPLQTGVRPDLGDNALMEMRDEIRSGFFLDLLTMPDFNRATQIEVMQWMQQRMTFISPMLSRVQEELLIPFVERAYGYMVRHSMLPRPTDDIIPYLRGQNLSVQFQSPMAMAQRMGEAQAAQQWITSLVPMAQVDPAIMDWVDTDELAQESGTGWYGVPQRLQRTRETVDSIRAERARQMQAMQQSQLALNAAQTAESGSKAIANVRMPA